MSFDSFLSENSFALERKISKGYSSEVFLVKHLPSGKLFALKAEKQKSPRKNMLQKEVSNLLLANSAGIGPKLYAFDVQERIVVMEFIEGKTFAQWLSEGPSKKQLAHFMQKLFEQAKRLDGMGLDHGQLAGKGKNILARKSGRAFEPVIIDFEKASQSRKVHNASQLEGFLFKNPRGAIASGVRHILGLS